MLSNGSFVPTKLKSLNMKKLLIVVRIILMGNTAKAQDYYHGLGGQINYGLFKSNFGI